MSTKAEIIEHAKQYHIGYKGAIVIAKRGYHGLMQSDGLGGGIIPMQPFEQGRQYSLKTFLRCNICGGPYGGHKAEIEICSKLWPEKSEPDHIVRVLGNRKGEYIKDPNLDEVKDLYFGMFYIEHKICINDEEL